MCTEDMRQYHQTSSEVQLSGEFVNRKWQCDEEIKEENWNG